jgi:hypothetical protein
MNNEGINLVKIANIKSKSQLKKYHKNTPINNLNYLFHYLILSNNLKALTLYNFPIDKFNSDGLNGFMLAAKEKRYNILNYLLDKYKGSDNKGSDIIYSRNKKNMNFVNYLYPLDKEYFNLINKYTSIKWTDMFQNYSTNNISGLDILFSKGDYKTIIKVINLLNFNYSNYMSLPYHFNLLNNNLNDTQIISILNLLEEKDKNILTYVDDMGYNIAHAIILKDSDELFKFIIKKLGKELNKYTPISGTHIFITAYKLGARNNNYSKAKYILKHVMNNCFDKDNYYETDNHGNNIVLNVLKIRNAVNKGNYEIEKTLLNNYTGWSIMNINKKTALDYIVNLDYNKYHSFVTSRNTYIDKKMNKKWYKYLMKLPIKTEDENINMISTPYVHSNMFQARFIDVGIFVTYLKEKYKNFLYIPIYKGDDITPEWDDDMQLPDELLRFNNNYPWVIIWNNPNSYWIHPYLNKLINKNKTKYKAACVFLSLRLPDGGLHAGVIFYNFLTNKIERFDPYGNTTIIDGKLDNILEEQLCKETNMKYCSPECYLPVAGFQTLSDENNLFNQKLGDFGGYCLAWCIWYVEHKLNNMKIEPKDLIRKTINKFMKMNIKPMEYIRNYANYISKFKLGYLKQLGIPENIISNEHINNNYMNIIKEAL